MTGTRASDRWVWLVMEVDNDHWRVVGIFETKAVAMSASKKGKAKSAAWRLRPYFYKVARFELKRE